MKKYNVKNYVRYKNDLKRSMPDEKSYDKYHGVTKFNVKTGIQEKSNSNIPSYTKIFANTLIKHAQNPLLKILE